LDFKAISISKLESGEMLCFFLRPRAHVIGSEHHRNLDVREGLKLRNIDPVEAVQKYQQNRKRQSERNK
jgi:hypothetical protein